MSGTMAFVLGLSAVSYFLQFTDDYLLSWMAKQGKLNSKHTFSPIHNTRRCPAMLAICSLLYLIYSRYLSVDSVDPIHDLWIRSVCRWYRILGIQPSPPATRFQRVLLSFLEYCNTWTIIFKADKTQISLFNLTQHNNNHLFQILIHIGSTVLHLKHPANI